MLCAENDGGRHSVLTDFLKRSRASLSAAVLDLPGVIEDVPGDAAGGVAGWPTSMRRLEGRLGPILDERFPGRGLSQHLQQCRPDRAGAGVLRGEVAAADAELGPIGRLALHPRGDGLVPGPAPPAPALP